MRERQNIDLLLIEVTLERVKEHCVKNGLAGYKCPKRVVMKEALPMSGAGKVVKYLVKQDLGVAVRGGQTEQKSTYA